MLSGSVKLLMQSVVALSTVYAERLSYAYNAECQYTECRLFWASFMLSGLIKVIMLSAVILSVIYAEFLI